MNVEARILEERYWETNTPVQPTDSPVPKIITQTTTSVDRGNGSIKSTPLVASKEKEASDRLTFLWACCLFSCLG